MGAGILCGGFEGAEGEGGGGEGVGLGDGEAERLWHLWWGSRVGRASSVVGMNLEL